MHLNKEKDIPVIFIHRGFQEYLKYTVACASDYHNRVILLGDEENRDLAVEWHPIKEYSSFLFEQFKRAYIHLSPNTKWFELICFERYFVLLEFMKKNRIRRCIMLDSDVLLFGKIDVKRHISDLDMGGGCEDKYKQVNPSVLYWTTAALEQFVLFCLTSYQENSKWQNLFNIYKVLKREGKMKSDGGVSDMTLLYLWMKTAVCKCKNFFLEDLEGCFIDGNCNYAEQNGTRYKMRKSIKIKKIQFKNKIPYIINDHSKRRKKVLAIHCQGNAKKYIRLLYKRHSCVLWYYIYLVKAV